VVADGAALPLRNGWADLVVYAQAWHWMQVPDATAEAARVLRPGGALAVWWNDVDAAEASWWQAQQQRLEAMNPNYDREYRTRDYAGELRATRCFAEVAEWQGHWVRSLDLDGYERWLRSKSYVAALGPRLPEFLAAERASLAAAFPSGLVEEPFRVTLCVARRPQC
jgi:SAM-dependent methyltransferase